jgi:uncharacterized protein YicC (UPF0701 family)
MADAEMVNLWIAVTEWLSKVVATAAIVLGAIWRWLTHMITKRVKEELEVAMRTITETTSRAIDSLRHEVRENDERTEQRIERLGDRITERVDNILAKKP